MTLAGVAACSTGADRYQGISLAADNPDAELRGLARRASEGDKHAQLALGIRFETGDGVPLDLRRAERLYRKAAATTGDVRAVYFPSVRPKTQGKVLPSWFRPPQAGLPAAQARLEALRERRRRERGGS
ncbi:MAG TPA: hypothetical protein VF702_04700 [Allosphingosinicella sp.]